LSFIHPYILWGLFAIAIPIIIHLFNFRRFKKVYFTNIRYLEELKQETRRKTRLRHLLILLMRIGAVAALVFAFAQPYIPLQNTPAQQEADNVVSIYVDNSFSMGARSTSGLLFDQAVVKAREVAMSFGASDDFQLITNDFEGKHQRFVSREEFLEMLDGISISPGVKTLSDVVQRQEDLLSTKPSANKSIFILSDFQESIANISEMEPDSSTNLYLMPLESTSRNNLYIDSCWFDSPVHQLDQNVTLVARIRNESEIDYEKIPVKLHIDGMQRALASFNLPAGQYIDVELPFTVNRKGHHYARLEITDYPIVYDDSFYLYFMVAEAIPVLSINEGEENMYLNTLFGNDDAYQFRNVNRGNINYDRLNSYNLIILNELQSVSSGLANELGLFLEKGGSLLVVPAMEMDLPSYRSFLGSLGAHYYDLKVTGTVRVTELDREHPLYNDVFEEGRERPTDNIDLPVVNAWYQLSGPVATGMADLLTMQNGYPFLSEKQFGKGRLYLLAAPLKDEFTNFPRHAIFVPTLFKMGLLSAATAPLYYVVKDNEVVMYDGEQPAGDQVFTIKRRGGEYEFIPETRMINNRLGIFVHDQVDEAGHYDLLDMDGVLTGLAFNYNRQESDLKCLSDGEVSDLLEETGLERSMLLKQTEKPVQQVLEEINYGKRLWKLFLILVLLFLAAETLLLRLWK
jgi:hypothetical protein